MSVCRSRSLTILVGSVALSAILATASRARADEPPANGSHTPDAAKAADVAKPAPAADDVRQWAKDLDSDIFVKRQEAARKLSEAGQKAVGPLAETAEGKSLEATTSAVDILHRLADSADAATRDAAKAALERLAQGSHAEAARLAKEALVPPASPNAVPGAPNNGGGIQFGGNIQLGNGGIIQIQPGGNIQIGPGGNLQPLPGGIQVFRIQANAAGGNRTVDVDDNGKKVRIQEDQNGIEVSVTKKVNGKDKTDTFKAKNADELKKKFPEAHKLYEKYAQNGGAGGLQIQAQIGGPLGGGFGGPIGNGGFGPALPGIAVPPGIAPVPQPADPKASAQREIDIARRMIQRATDKLKNNASPNDVDAVKKAIENLDEAGQKLDDAKKQLDR